jgi:hypothetical protein
MRTFAGGCLGAGAGLVAGLVVGVALAIVMVPDRPGHALDGIRSMMGVVFVAALVCTVLGCAVGALVAVRTGRPGPLPPDDE